MSWSKITNKKIKKPLKWWFFKLMCEYAYSIEHGSGKRYYYFLNKCCEQGFNLYGEPIINS